MPRDPNANLEPKQPTLAQDAFSHYHRALHAYLVRRLSNAEDARDAMQEVFFRLLRVERTDLVRNPQAYLYGIASHVVREFRMRAQRERAAFESSEPPRHSSMDELGEGVGMERDVEVALAQLSHVELRILIYERRDGLSIGEIASKTGLSVHTVKKYLFRALARVRAHLARHEAGS